MSDRIEGVPEGYRLGRVIGGSCYSDGERHSITFELIPIEPEQPKQLEAVVAIAVRELGYDTEVSIRSMLLQGITHRLAEEMKLGCPDYVTIREKGAK